MQLISTLFPAFQKSSRERSKAIGNASMLIVILAGSTSTPFAKELTNLLAPLAILFFSEVISLFFTALSFGVLPLLKELASMKKQRLVPLIILSIITGVAAPIIIFTGLGQTQAINAELFLRSQSFLLFLFAAFALHENLRRSDVIACVSVALGVIVISLKGFTEGLAIGSGDALILLGACMHAAGGVIYKKHLAMLHTEIMLFARGLASVACFLAFLPFMNDHLLIAASEFNSDTLVALWGYGLISIFLYMFSFYEAMERLPVHTVSLLLPFISIGSVLFAHLYLGEAILWYHIFGGFLIIFGSLSIQITCKYFGGKTLEQHLRTHQQSHTG